MLYPIRSRPTVRAVLGLAAIALLWSAPAALQRSTHADDQGSLKKTPRIITLFDGETLEGWAPCFKRGGEVTVKDGEIRMPVGNPMTGITTTRDDLPRVDYELTYEAKRTEGADFFAAATFPVEEEFVTLVNGGWGGSITGLSRVNGADASENQTGGFVPYKNDTWYRFKVIVTDDVILCYIDDKLEVCLDHDDLELDTRLETRVNEPLGFSTWESAGALRKIQIRRLTEAEVEAADDVAD